jgi:aerobic-type carbon monoxide dehydrogenase small subunit (CoxS/CutS family)
MASISFTVNGNNKTLDAQPDTPLLWILRDTLGLTGTKYGCGVGVCGSCTVHIDGEAMRSCATPVSSCDGKSILTIEGLEQHGHLHPVQEAWIEEDVPQCGYCQSGMIMSAVALLKQKKHPSDADINDAMSGNLCRCGTYKRVRKAIHLAATKGGSL